MEGDQRKEFVKGFGDRFTRALGAKGLTKSEAARRMGHPLPNRMVEYATGYRLPPLDTLSEIIEGLDLDPAILFPDWLTQARRHRARRKARAKGKVVVDV